MNPFINHYYINLENRPDRNKNAIEELSKLDITPNRFNAIKTESGIIGCCLSHMRIVQEAKIKNLPYICIFEDDIKIYRANLLMKKVKKLINSDFDIMLLGGNNFKPYIEHDDYIKVSRCYTTTAYIIKNHYYDTYLKNLNDGLKLLLKTGDRKYSLDSYSHELQQRDNWILITPICVYQKADYSDIEEREVNYETLMKNYDK